MAREGELRLILRTSLQDLQNKTTRAIHLICKGKAVSYRIFLWLVTLKGLKQTSSLQNCGLVAEARCIDERSEWRTFGDKVIPGSPGAKMTHCISHMCRVHLLQKFRDDDFIACN